MQHFEQSFIEMIRLHPESEGILPGVLPDSFEQLECKLDTKLPPSYKEFLAHVNGGSVGPIRLFGIERNDYLDFGRQLKELASFIPSVASHVMIPFASDWGGSLYCFDTYNANDEGELPVWFWNHEYSEEPADAPFVWTRIDDEFFAFILKQFSTEGGG